MSNYAKDVRYGQGDTEKQYFLGPDGVNRENVNRFVAGAGAGEDTYLVRENDATIIVETTTHAADVFLPALSSVRNGQAFTIQRIGAGAVLVKVATLPGDDDVNEAAAAANYPLTTDGQCIMFRKGSNNTAGTVVTSWYTCVAEQLG